MISSLHAPFYSAGLEGIIGMKMNMGDINILDEAGLQSSSFYYMIIESKT
jgi:hypothetical protein